MLRSSRLQSSILWGSTSEVVRIREFEREINLNTDRKRFWLGKITSIESKIMNESFPISLNYFAKLKI